MSLKLSSKAKARLAWMDAYRECSNAALVCRHYGIPLRTFWRWQKRYDPWDLTSLEDHSKRPKSFPHKITWEIEKLVLKTKQDHPRWGKEKIALFLKKQNIIISGKTCWRVCKRHGLIIHYRTRKRKPPKPRVNWAEVKLPGDLVEVDVKHLCIAGRKYYQYTAIDVISRLRYAEIYRAADMATSVKFLTEVKKRFSFSIKVIQTDNGSEFGRLVSTWCQKHKVRHVFSHKARPVENGHVERSHRIDEEEFYSLGNLTSNFNELREKFAAYLQMYNHLRPHWALGGKTPMEALNSYSLKPCHMS